MITAKVTFELLCDFPGCYSRLVLHGNYGGLIKEIIPRGRQHGWTFSADKVVPPAHPNPYAMSAKWRVKCPEHAFVYRPDAKKGGKKRRIDTQGQDVSQSRELVVR